MEVSVPVLYTEIKEELDAKKFLSEREASLLSIHVGRWKKGG